MFNNYQNNYPNNFQNGNSNVVQAVRNTNIIFVTSANEAVMRTPNDADMVYIDQNRPVMYRVVADMWGRKSLAEYPYNVPSTEEPATVSRTEFNELVAKVEGLLNANKETTNNG